MERDRLVVFVEQKPCAHVTVKSSAPTPFDFFFLCFPLEGGNKETRTQENVGREEEEEEES